MILAPVLRQFFGYTNSNLVGGLLYSYVAGTTTPLATYTDATGVTPNTNPVVLDANGSAPVWIDPTLAYKFVLTDSLGTSIFTVDQVSGGGNSGAPFWNATSNYSQGNIVADSSGAGIFYVSVQSNNVGNALTNVAYWRALGGAIRTVTGNTSLLVTDELLRSNSTSSSLTHTLPACSTTPIGKKITLKDVGTGSNTTTVKGSGSDNVDGANTWAVTLTVNSQATFENNGTSWDASVWPITTTQIGVGAVTQAKLAARATGSNVAAGGVINTSSSGSVTVSGSTFTNVTNLSGTIATTGRPVMLIVQPDGSGSTPFIQPGSGTLDLQLFNNTSSSEVGRFNFNGADSGEYPAAFSLVDFPTSGTYNYLVRARVSGSNGTVAFIRLVAFET